MWPGDAWKRPASLGNHPSWPMKLWPEHLQHAQLKESKITEILFFFFAWFHMCSFTALMPFIWRWSTEWIFKVIYYLACETSTWAMVFGGGGEQGLKHENMWHMLRIRPPGGAAMISWLFISEAVALLSPICEKKQNGALKTRPESKMRGHPPRAKQQQVRRRAQASTIKGKERTDAWFSQQTWRMLTEVLCEADGWSVRMTDLKGPARILLSKVSSQLSGLHHHRYTYANSKFVWCPFKLRAFILELALIPSADVNSLSDLVFK